MIIVVIFGILAMLCLIYYVYAASYAGMGSSFLGFWLLAFAGCLVISFLFSTPGRKYILSHIPRTVKIIVLCVIMIGVIFFIVLEGMIISQMNAVPDKDVEYVIVLGAQVRGTRVTKSLAKRLDAAATYIKDKKDVKIIVSGGQGKGEDVSEAAAMKKYLVERGVDESRIIEENKSTTTKENLIFSREKMEDGDAAVAIVTNNFHVYRAVKIAKKLGYKNVQGLAGKSDNHLLLNYMVREAMAIAKEYIVGNI